jgi:molybdate/tungstate transport system permease protein
MKFEAKYIFLYLFAALALLFIVVPVINMFFATDLDVFFQTARDSEVKKSIFLTLWVSLAATVLCAAFAVPLAYVIAKKSFRFKTLLLGIINIPIVIPHSAAGIAVLGLVSRDTVIGKMAGSVGLSFIDSPLGIGVAMAYVSLPFLIISAVNGFSEVPEKLENAALNLGASRWQTFFKISLPLAKQSVFSGLILMFSRGISEFGAVIMLAYFPTITPILIYDRFTSFGLTYARPVAVIFVLICLTVFLFFYLLTNKKRRD